MSVYAEVLGLVNGEQDIASKQTLNQLRMAQIAKDNNQIAIDQQTRKISQAFEDSQQRAADNAAGQPVGPPTPPQGIDANPQIQAIQQQVNRAQQDYQYHSQLAAALRRGGGDLKLAQQYDDNAANAMKIVEQGQLRLLAERKVAVQEVGSLAGTATPDNFDQVRQQLDAQIPGWDRKLDVDISPLAGGATVWGPRTQKALQTLANTSLTRYQQLEDQHNQAGELLRQQSNETQRAEITSRGQERQSRDMARRERIDRDDRRDAARDARDAAKDTNAARVKEPAAKEVDAQTPVLARDLNLSATDAKAASYDYLRYRNTEMAQGRSQDDAENAALSFVKSRVQPGDNYDASPWWKPGKDMQQKAGTYSKQKAPEDSDLTLMKRLDIAGIGAQVTKGKVTGTDGAPVSITTDAQFALLPSGTTFVGPDGKTRRKP
jgi:hypothetical protein